MAPIHSWPVRTLASLCDGLARLRPDLVDLSLALLLALGMHQLAAHLDQFAFALVAQADALLERGACWALQGLVGWGLGDRATAGSWTEAAASLIDDPGLELGAALLALAVELAGDGVLWWLLVERIATATPRVTTDALSSALGAAARAAAITAALTLGAWTMACTGAERWAAFSSSGALGSGFWAVAPWSAAFVALALVGGAWLRTMRNARVPFAGPRGVALVIVLATALAATAAVRIDLVGALTQGPL